MLDCVQLPQASPIEKMFPCEQFDPWSMLLEGVVFFLPPHSFVVHLCPSEGFPSISLIFFECALFGNLDKAHSKILMAALWVENPFPAGYTTISLATPISLHSKWSFSFPINDWMVLYHHTPLHVLGSQPPAFIVFKVSLYPLLLWRHVSER